METPHWLLTGIILFVLQIFFLLVKGGYERVKKWMGFDHSNAPSDSRAPSSQAPLPEAQTTPKTGAAHYIPRRDYRTDANELRESEVLRLSQGWLTNTETYFHLEPQQFENAIAELFRALGYKVKQTPFTNDGGKDAIAHKDGKKYLIECKRYSETNSVGRRDLQIFVAAMQDEKADGGFYMSTGIFAATAKEYAKTHRIHLYDRSRLPRLVNKAYPLRIDISTAKAICTECGAVISVPVNDAPATTSCPNGHSVTSDIVKADIGIISSIDVPYCDADGSVMRLVNWNGSQFWGCPRYPACKRSKQLLRHQRAQVKIENDDSQFLTE